MKKEHTIQEAASYFGLPKATLLYWEKEGLIHFDRISGNRYRKLSPHTIFEIENVLHMRNLGIPIKEIKAAPLMSLEEKYRMYQKAVDEAIRQEQLLKQLRASAQKQLTQIQEINELRQHPYRSESPDFSYLIAHSQDTISLECTDTGLFVLLMEHPEQGHFTETFMQDQANQKDILWERPSDDRMWRTFLLDVIAVNEERRMEELPKHLQALRTMGYETGTLVARYLSEAMENGVYHIYFKAYVEVTPLSRLSRSCQENTQPQ